MSKYAARWDNGKPIDAGFRIEFDPMAPEPSTVIECESCGSLWNLPGDHPVGAIDKCKACNGRFVAQSRVRSESVVLTSQLVDLGYDR